VTEPFAELPSVPPPGATPLPSFLESYALAETQAAPLGFTALDLPAPEPTADMPAALDPIVLDAPAAEGPVPSPVEDSDDTLAEAEIETLIDVPPPAPAAGPAPHRLEALDLGRDADARDGAQDTRPEAAPLSEGIDVSPSRDEAPAPASVPLEPVQPPQPELFASTPRRSLVPLIAMLIAGIALGIPAGYLMAPRSQPAPAAPSAPVSKPAPPSVAPTPATTAAPATPTATTVPPAPAPAARRKPAERKATAAATRTPPSSTPKPTSFVGSLSISSRPAGATVLLDGRVVGTTPLTLPEAPAGSHAVRLVLEGYRSWSVSAQVVAGQQRKVNASLERQERRPER
jgi:hypothetical protein